MVNQRFLSHQKRRTEIEDSKDKVNMDPAVAATCTGFQPQGRQLALVDAHKDAQTNEPDQDEEKIFKKPLQSLKKLPLQLWRREVNRKRKRRKTTRRKGEERQKQR